MLKVFYVRVNLVRGIIPVKKETLLFMSTTPMYVHIYPALPLSTEQGSHKAVLLSQAVNVDDIWESSER